MRLPDRLYRCKLSVLNFKAKSKFKMPNFYLFIYSKMTNDQNMVTNMPIMVQIKHTTRQSIATGTLHLHGSDGNATSSYIVILSMNVELIIKINEKLNAKI